MACGLHGFPDFKEPSMRNFILLFFLGLATSAAAQEKDKDKDKATQDRVRAERSAGGTREVTPEEKAGANVGAGPHISRRTGPAPKRHGEETEVGGQSSSSGESARVRPR
jgi:hypothetical protein